MGNNEREIIHPLEEYIRSIEPSQVEKSGVWRTAIGLQDVDGLKPSQYLINTAKQHIEGDISIDEAAQRINSYYKSKINRKETSESRTEEADKVSVRIAEILSEKSFTLSPVEYLTIHRRLFNGIYKFAGKIRNYDITKREWVLDGDTVLYGAAWNLKETLEYDIDAERKFSYNSLSLRDAMKHICVFVANLWQIHVFGEGNTRATAVFLIKYLRTFGFDVCNTPFEQHSWYFRNALVRANYTNLQRGISATTVFLERFLGNILLGESNELKNRTMHVRHSENTDVQRVENETSKSQIGTLSCTLEESAVLMYLSAHQHATQKELAMHIGKSERTIKRLTVKLTEKGLLIRRNGRRNGYWEVKSV